MKIEDYWSWLSTEVGCMICEMVPASIHHCIGGSIADAGIVHGKSQKNSDWLVLPLCYNHHQGREGLHQIGVRTWESRYQTQVSFLNDLAAKVSFDLLSLAGLKK